MSSNKSICELCGDDGIVEASINGVISLEHCPCPKGREIKKNYDELMRDSRNHG